MIHRSATAPIVLGAALVAGSIALDSLAADWPQYRGPNTDGTTAEKLSGKPSELWRAETPLGFSSFSVADGKAYTLVVREVEGSPMEGCLALDANTGKEAWFTPLTFAKYDGGGNSGAKGNDGGDGPRSTPSVSDGRVYIIDKDLNIYCLNAADGKEVWKKDLGKEHGAKNIKWQNAASPLLDSGMLFCAGGGKGEALLGIDAKTGKTVWKGEDDKMTHATPILAEFGGVKQVVFFTQEGLVAVLPKDGKVLWRHDFPFKVSTAASPVVVGEDLIYCSAGYGVGAGLARVKKVGLGFEAEEVWRKENDLPNHWSTPVFRDGHLYGMFTFKDYGDGPISCVEVATGKVKWSQPGFGPGHVTLAGDKILASTDAGDVVVIEATPDAYKEIDRIKGAVSGKCWHTPILANGRLYIRSTKEAVCYEVSGKTASLR